MNRYHIIREIGGGAFGTVYEATDTHTGQPVAIKRIKQSLPSWQECLNLREVASITKIPKHPNLVRLRQLIYESNTVWFVFEFLPRDLLRLMREHRSPVPESAIRRIMWQVLQGLAHMHRHGFFHRDLKPENLLCLGDSIETAEVKLCDFGQARETRSRPPYTDYVSTRWYRAPEILLRSRYYNSPVDIWAAGVLMAEMFAGRPVFPGSSEVNQLYLILEAVGAPSAEQWPEGMKQMNALGLKMPRGGGRGLSLLCPRASAPALELLRDLLQLNPARRVTATAALASEWFAEFSPSPSKSAVSGTAKASSALGTAASSFLSVDSFADTTGSRPKVSDGVPLGIHASSTSQRAGRHLLGVSEAEPDTTSVGRSTSVPRRALRDTSLRESSLRGAGYDVAASMPSSRTNSPGRGVSTTFSSPRQPGGPTSYSPRAGRLLAASGSLSARDDRSPVHKEPSARDLFAMARELGVGVSPHTTTTPAIPRDGFVPTSISSSAAPRAPAVSGMRKKQSFGPSPKTPDVDTDTLEALLGSLEQSRLL
jgi:serine/threonine protein kinase